jgi:hypothetical protein
MELPEEREAILAAIYGGRKIEAIKLVRESANCGLKEAKEFVEKLSAELYAKEPDKFTVKPTGKSGCMGVVLAAVALVAVACAAALTMAH